jgi:hypothetical protein
MVLPILVIDPTRVAAFAQLRRREGPPKRRRWWRRTEQQRARPAPVALVQPCDDPQVLSERDESIQSWRRLLGLADGQGIGVSDGWDILPGSTSSCQVEQLLASAEWLMRRRLRQTWGALRPGDRQTVLQAADGFDPSEPIIEVTEARKSGAAWLLAAMSWSGCRHPAALRSEPLHPPTGLVRWLSMFDIRQQVESAGEIHEALLKRMAIVERRSQWLIDEMLRRGLGVALLPELLRWEPADCIGGRSD